MAKKQAKKIITELKGIENLLNQQTGVILSAVDEKIGRVDEKIGKLDVNLMIVDRRISSLEKRISKLEIKVDQRFDQLITTLDKFLKRLTDMEDEFETMKMDINRLKKVIREKLGIDLN